MVSKLYKIPQELLLMVVFSYLDSLEFKDRSRWEMWTTCLGTSTAATASVFSICSAMTSNMRSGSSFNYSTSEGEFKLALNRKVPCSWRKTSTNKVKTQPSAVMKVIHAIKTEHISLHLRKQRRPSFFFPSTRTRHQSNATSALTYTSDVGTRNRTLTLSQCLCLSTSVANSKTLNKPRPFPRPKVKEKSPRSTIPITLRDVSGKSSAGRNISRIFSANWTWSASLGARMPAAGSLVNSPGAWYIKKNRWEDYQWSA